MGLHGFSFMTPLINNTVKFNNWKNLSESNKLLLELLASSRTGCKQFSPFIGGGEETVEDVDGLDVVSLRERLCIAELDVDGSREMLVDRWKQQLAFASRW